MKMKYEQPDMNFITCEYEKLLESFEYCNRLEEQIDIIGKINEIRDNFFSMYWISYMNYLLDVNSEYWGQQEAFFAKNEPIIDQFRLRYFEKLLHSKFKKQLVNLIGNKVFQIAEIETALISDDIYLEKEKEKILMNKYSKLVATTKVEFQGKTISLATLSKFLSSENRLVRKEASALRSKALAEIEAEIDNILDDLIRVRTDMAKKLGFKSYTEVGYLNMKRIGYSQKEVSTFRQEVLNYIVPKMLQLKEKQKQELNLDELYSYDNPILFKGGNPVPKGDTKWIINQALTMYQTIHPDIYELFKIMLEKNCMDLESREGKSAGGITTYIPTEKLPYFISTFYGNSHDIQVLTHEFGHCFQLYSSRFLKYYENWWPTFDTCEIHSIGMELLTLSYMERFFKEDAEKYRYQVIYNNLSSFCTLCLGDEFQHILYDQPNLTKKQRKEKYKKLEKKYIPWLKYEDNDYLERGNGYQAISHIFTSPFYYIDYALAASVAFEFYLENLSDKEKGWQHYVDFCSLGGSYSFLALIEKNNLKSPFAEGTLAYLVKQLNI